MTDTTENYTAEQMAADGKAIADEFVGKATALQEEFAARLEAFAERAMAGNIPEYLMVATVDEIVKRMRSIGS